MKKPIKNTGTKIQKTDELRKRTEDIAIKKAALSLEDLNTVSPEDILKKLNDLQVYQIELEMQNEELRRTHLELDTARARYFDLYDNAPVGYLTISEKGLILEANLTASTLLGITRDTLVKKPLPQFIHPEDQDLYYLHSKQLFETGVPQSCDLRLFKKSSAAFWSHLEATLARDESGAPVCRVILSDISKRKRYEDELLKASERLSLAQSSAGAGVWDWDMPTGNLNWSPEFFRLFGLDPVQDEATFDTWRSVLHPQDLLIAETKINEAIRDKKPLYNEYRIILPNGDVRWISAFGNISYDSQGKPLRMTGICIDNTQHKLLEQKLHETEIIFEELINTVPSGVAIYEVKNDGLLGKDYIVKDFNKMSLIIEGCKKEDVIGKSLYDLRPNIDQYGLISVFRKVWKTGIPDYYPEKIYIDEKFANYYENRVFRLPNGDIVAIYNDITEHKQAEEALRKSEERFRLLSEAAFEAIVIHEGGILLNANDQYFKMFGYEPEEAIGKEMMSLTIAPEALAFAKEQIALDNMGPYESIGLRKDGTKFPMELRARKMEYKGRIVRFGTIMDITERKMVEEALRKSEAEYRAILDATPFPVALVDTQDDKIDFWSSSAEILFGHTAPTAQEWYQLAYPDPDYRRKVVGRWKSFLEIARESRQTVNTGEYRITCSNGSVRICELYATFLKDRLIVTFNDITERKHAEDAMRESEERYRELVRYAPAGIYEVDYETNRFISVNDIICEYTGYTRDELLTMNLFGLLSEESQKLMLERLEMLMAGKETKTTVEYCIRTKNGNNLWGLINARYIYEAGKLKGATGVIYNITERKLAEQQLRRANIFLDSIIENIPDMIFIKDARDLRFIRFNRAGENLLGCSRNDLLGKSDYDIFPKEQADHFTENDREVLREKKILDISEESIQTLNMGKRILHTKKVPLCNADGEPEFLLGISEDITVRKCAEEALLRKEKDLRESQRIAHIGSWRLDVATNEVVWTEELYNMYGFDPSLPPPPYTEHMKLFTPESWERLSTALARTRETGIPYTLELETVRKDGSNGWMWVQGHADIDSSGKTVELWGAAQDITERKRIEVELRESNELFSLFMRHSPIYLYIKEVTPSRSIVLQASDNYEKMLGRPVSEIIGKSNEELFPPEMAAKFTADDWAATSGSEVVITDYEDMNGRSFTSIKFPIVRGDKTLLAGYTIDVTELKKAGDEKARLEAQLQQAQKMESIGRLAGGVAHDFNNMLAVIFGHAELALMKIDPSQPYYADLQEIRKAADRSASLTRQLLAFARKQTIAPRVLNLNETVNGMLNMLRKLIGEDIDLSWQPGEGVWPLKVDPSQIDQILANLCVNARDAIADVGRIIIKTGTDAFDEDYCTIHRDMEPGEYVCLSVSDNGCGMDRETLANVFEPFFTTKELGKGTGLGLATVFGIVKQNNGFINVYSKPGKGTTFTIYLPRYTGEVQAQADVAARKSPGGNETILLVEDEPGILNMVRIMLMNLGYTVLVASSPVEAISMTEKYARGDIHMIITDVVMPEMNGYDLVRILSSIYPGLKSLFMSGYATSVIANHGLADGRRNFIQKPFSIMDLAAKVREVLDGGGEE